MLTAHDLTVQRGGAAVLREVSLEVRPREITVICGPNGAGKSSLLMALAGLEDGCASSVLMNKARLADVPARERARQIGYLPQSGEVAWDLDVETLAMLGRLPWGTSPGENAAAVREALATLDLSGFARRPLRSLSGGERARALLARVLAGRPRWILADEPLAALDLSHQLALLARFAEVAKGGVGVVLVVHDLALAMNHADRVIVLNKGQVAADGPPAEALAPDVIAQVWGVAAEWLGEPGRRALAPCAAGS